MKYIVLFCLIVLLFTVSSIECANTSVLAREFANKLKTKVALKRISRNVNNVKNYEEKLQAFRIFDTNGDMFIDATELKNIMTNLGERLTDEQVAEMIREADIDGDNRINLDEYIQVTNF